MTSILALGQNVFETEIWNKRWRKEREEKKRGGREKRKKKNVLIPIIVENQNRMRVKN